MTVALTDMVHVPNGRPMFMLLPGTWLKANELFEAQPPVVSVTVTVMFVTGNAPSTPVTETPYRLRVSVVVTP